MCNMEFSIIVAMDKKKGIGKDGAIPWRLPGELSYFHRVTTETQDPAKQNAVVMGRKTWESIPLKRRPLPGRVNCVITRNEQYTVPEGVLRFFSFHAALDALGEMSNIEHVFNIGGAQLCEEAIHMPECMELYITEVTDDFHCDTFFPEIPADFQLASVSEVQEENGIRYVFKRYER